MPHFAPANAEDKQFLARVEEWIQLTAQGKRDCCFTPFLNEHQEALAQAVLERETSVQWLLFGGYSHAVRKIMGIFSPWEEADSAVFPIAVLDILLPKGADISHRDVLGSLMALQIKREMVGDILLEPQNRCCHVFLQQTLAPFVCDSLCRIGRYGVKTRPGIMDASYVRKDTLQSLYGTVSSLRMDALVSMLTGLSREKGAALIQAELVQHNAMPVCSQHASFLAGDCITIRKYGKYRIDRIGEQTKKGRLPIYYSKFVSPFDHT